jgi:hypothetical protein
VRTTLASLDETHGLQRTGHLPRLQYRQASHA